MFIVYSNLNLINVEEILHQFFYFYIFHFLEVNLIIFKLKLKNNNLFGL